METRDKLIKLNKKRQCVGRNSVACVNTLDLGYSSKEITTSIVNSRLKEIKNSPTVLLYANVAT